MHYRLSEKDSSEYLATEKLPLTIRPQYCQACGAKVRFHRHSSYHRKKIYIHGQWFLEAAWANLGAEPMQYRKKVKDDEPIR